MKLVGDGFVLLVLGQVVVFLFLGLMVMFIQTTAWFVKQFLHPGEAVFSQNPSLPLAEEVGAEIAAATAVIQHVRAHT